MSLIIDVTVSNSKISYQISQAVRDYKSLSEEQTATEQNLIETMEQERVIEARLADRTLRPVGELTKDEVDRKLRDELGRLRSFSKELRTTHDRIRYRILRLYFDSRFVSVRG